MFSEENQGLCDETGGGVGVGRRAGGGGVSMVVTREKYYLLPPLV